MSFKSACLAQASQRAIMTGGCPVEQPGDVYAAVAAEMYGTPTDRHVNKGYKGEPLARVIGKHPALALGYGKHA